MQSLCRLQRGLPGSVQVARFDRVEGSVSATHKTKAERGLDFYETPAWATTASARCEAHYRDEVAITIMGGQS